MYATDFYYDGQCLSDFGFMICTFGTESSVADFEAGSEITFNTVKRNYGKSYSLAGTSYDSCVTTDFIIAKDPEFYDYDYQITNDEFRDIFRWLNRKEYLPFHLLNRHEPWCDPCFFNVSFNINKMMFADAFCGIKLTLVSDSPYGYGNEVVINASLEPGRSFRYRDESDEIGYIYPDMVLTCKESGDYIITNSVFYDEPFVIKDCKKNEQIEINGQTLELSSSSGTHKIMDCFNYNYLKIGNTYREVYNEFTANKKCELVLKYKPVIKDAP